LISKCVHMSRGGASKFPLKLNAGLNGHPKLTFYVYVLVMTKVC